MRVAGVPEPLTGDTAAKVLLFDQYVAFGDGPQDDRRDFLAGATRALTERLLSGSLPLGSQATALQPMVQQKHLMASTRSGRPAWVPCSTASPTTGYGYSYGYDTDSPTPKRLRGGQRNEAASEPARDDASVKSPVSNSASSGAPDPAPSDIH